MEQPAWIVLQHVAWESPGLIAVEAAARGLRLDIRRLDQGDRIPGLENAAGLIVMGGPMAVYEEGQFPFLCDEINLIREAIQSCRPVLGVCLGAQLLASALGARVFPGQAPEIGCGSVELTPAGKMDPIFAGIGDSFPVFHWHGDTFDLPEGAVLLASNQRYSQQAFRFGRCAYGMQFHIEPDSQTWTGWREHLPSELLGEDGSQLNRIEATGRRMIASFFDMVSS